MPVAVFNYVHAEMYKTRPAEVAGLVMVSTVLSFITLPALMWFVMGH
jgi:predicted permease